MKTPAFSLKRGDQGAGDLAQQKPEPADQAATDRLSRSSPMRLRQRVIDERSNTDHLIGQVIGVLEDGQPGHQSRRQRRMAGIIRLDLAEATFQEAEIHRPRQRDQWMLQIDDLIEPGAKQILFTRLLSFPWPNLVPPPKHLSQ